MDQQLTLDLQAPRRRPMLAYWHPITGALDRKYLRVCAIYRLLKRRLIGRARATELLAQRHSPAEMKTLQGTLDQWRMWPIPEMLP